MEEASLSSYRPVIVHAWFLATDRALGALVRLRGYAGQSKARIGMSSFFFLIVCFTSIGKTGSFHHVLCLELGPLVGKGKRSKLAAILLLDITPLITCCPTSSFCFHVLALLSRDACSSPRRRTFKPASAATDSPTSTCMPSVLNLADLADLNWTRTINHTAATTNYQSYTTTDDR
jgi:hypothetical protein